LRSWRFHTDFGIPATPDDPEGPVCPKIPDDPETPNCGDHPYGFADDEPEDGTPDDGIVELFTVCLILFLLNHIISIF